TLGRKGAHSAAFAKTRATPPPGPTGRQPRYSTGRHRPQHPTSRGTPPGPAGRSTPPAAAPHQPPSPTATGPARHNNTQAGPPPHHRHPPPTHWAPLPPAPPAIIRHGPANRRQAREFTEPVMSRPARDAQPHPDRTILMVPETPP